MNEVTKIHLGRQAFAISAEAHHDLRDYLDAIKQRVHDAGVVSEVELRMAELLSERGVSGEKVILPGDVDFLKEQLGDPKDFAEDGETEATVEKPTSDAKRLFRDTDNAMLAGVAAGLANYFGVEVLLIRLLFIIATFTGGWGILLYLVMWLLVPEAKTPSERLQMAGKPVNIGSLKEVVERADVKGAARRANNSLAGPINTLFHIVLKVVGVYFMVIGLALLLSLAGGATYVFLHSGTIVQDNLFPVGLREHLLVYIVAAVCALIALFIVLLGMAIFRRKWPIHAWITGTLVGLTFVGLAVGSALAADVAPQVRSRYNANTHTVTRVVQPFTKVDLDNIGNDQNVIYQYSSTYSVTFHYYGHPDLSAIKIHVVNGSLVISSRQFNPNRNCQELCIPNTYNLTITVSSPNAPAILYPGAPNMPAPPALASPPSVPSTVFMKN